ncbi:MAG TPA: hypothetical protein VGR35_00555 [Tepidisphaeraceae bacterium]|nr:hypothetical protein [Tepidisphaeraceae bacterium]
MADFVSDDVEGEAGTAGPAGRPAAPPTTPPIMAVPVTRHDQISGGEIVGGSGPKDWQYLISGVDTLDLGCFVTWDGKWNAITEKLAKGKSDAEGTQGILLNLPAVEQCLIWPNGKPPQYRYHLQLPHAHVYLQERQQAAGSTPNVYVSLTSESLWKRGLDGAITSVRVVLERLGGRIERMLPSRCDLAADFRVPGGLSLAFLMSHKVSRTDKFEHHLTGDVLETFRAGRGDSAIQARIYDKGKEIFKSDKRWFLDLWMLPDGADVWRIEFQLRRQILKQFQIHDVETLKEYLGDLWESLTKKFFSLRLNDNENTTRRTIHAFWQDVIDVSDRLGWIGGLNRQYRSGTAPPQWYVSHVSGCLVPFAVRLNLSSFDDALDNLFGAVREHWAHRSFEDRYATEAIRLGMPAEGKGAADV